MGDVEPEAIHPPSPGINSARSHPAALWRSWPMAAGKTASRGRVEEGRRSSQRIREEHRATRFTLSSRVTGTRRESAYNERALSVCALLFTCLRARYASYRLTSPRATLSTDAPPLSFFLFLAANRSRATTLCARVSARVCVVGGSRARMDG